MDFEELLAELAGLIGREVFVEVRAPGDVEVVTMRGHLAAADDLGDFERQQGIGGPGHDRLLFQLREHPYPEGFYLDRRLVESAHSIEDPSGPGLRVVLLGGYELHVVRGRAGE